MRVRIYPDGNDSAADEVDFGAGGYTLADAVEDYARDRQVAPSWALYIVEPADDEARSLYGWKNDGHGLYRVFGVQARMQWEARSVHRWR